jgi:uncharacterized protein (TIGR02588 family)
MIDLKKNSLEWAVFAVSLVLVVAVLGYLIYVGITGGDRPPMIDVQLGAAERQGERFVVPVTVENSGDQVAENVTVEVELTLPSGEMETGSIDIDFLPRESTRNGWVTFLADPESATEVVIRVPGYKQP